MRRSTRTGMFGWFTRRIVSYRIPIARVVALLSPRTTPTMTTAGIGMKRNGLEEFYAGEKMMEL